MVTAHRALASLTLSNG